ncbi:MAG: tryptophan--tRNA ligase [Chlamydiae bacterium]|nr:tryptophan--tRNA ligase [Chlamydiota bacterium]
MTKKIVLTGDRTSGPLHLGHYVGSLANRLKLQDDYQQFIMLADMQALTDHASEPDRIVKSILEVALDYLAVGIDPKKSTIFIQSLIPALSELTMYYLNLITWNRLKHNPTVKAEIVQKGFGENVPAGFMIYPISQAADITAFKANIVPVGDDQLPMIEQTVEIVRKFNRTYNTSVLIEPEAMIPAIARLPGIDGQAKMSKTLNNAIYLSDPADIVAKKVKGMYTDPNHLRVEDPGKVEGNPVFTYLDVFYPDKKKLQELKEHYQRGGLGDSIVKKELLEALQAFLDPVRKKREELKKDLKEVMKILKEGSDKANAFAENTLKEVKQAMHLDIMHRLF